MVHRAAIRAASRGPPGRVPGRRAELLFAAADAGYVGCDDGGCTQHIGADVPPLMTSAGMLQCAHGGMVPLVPAGPRPLIGGSPGIVATDLMGKVAAGCAFNISGAPAPCVVVSVVSGICTKVAYGGTPALHMGLSCATSNGTPTMPVSSAGQTTVQGS